MSACPARGLCAGMAIHPHRVVGAAQGRPRVKHSGPAVRAPAGPDMRALPPSRPLPVMGSDPNYRAWLMPRFLWFR